MFALKVDFEKYFGCKQKYMGSSLSFFSGERSEIEPTVSKILPCGLMTGSSW
jgi:hypothetical protein